ncbi:MAG: dTDP-4-dehydrorhamnose reductase [candidate division Zixibacteria bacterium]|nr:dTDP-4-dehydrorhamnose reductase [candidate division Zixibacteria bacterium]
MKKNKILLFGKNGLLGNELYQNFRHSNAVISPSHDECDITNVSHVKETFESIKPDIVINAAGFTDVDRCEIEREKANTVNFVGTKNIVNECQKYNCHYLTYSTDYVFDGEKSSPYIETDKPQPINYYGETKLNAEKIIQQSLIKYSILRVSWLYGMYRDNFLKLIIKSGLKANKTNVVLPIVNNQIGSPTSVSEIVAQTKIILENKITGVVHCSSQGKVSRYEMTKMIFDYYNINTKIKPCLLSDRKHDALRPMYSCLENKKLNDRGFNIMKSSETALIEFLDLNRENLLNAM